MTPRHIRVAAPVGTSEVYVQDFPTMTVRQQIPVGGGEQPHWREDSGEVYYISPRGKIVAVKIRLGTKIEMGPATELFQTHTEGLSRHTRCAIGGAITISA